MRKATLTLTLLAAVALAGCGGGASEPPATSGGTPTTSTVTTTLSDPPVCEAPAGDFEQVWVTVTRVRAHISDAASSGDGGWVDLADLTASPMQFDLLGGAAGACTLATLGVVPSLPAGRYQQIRLHLLSNNPPGGAATPSPNHCASVGGFNCVQFENGQMELLLLSSQVQTGIKIPPGQIAGGGLVLEEGQTADINIDFDACRSIVIQGNGDVRLKPTLHAGEISVASTISGRVVDQTTTLPLVNGMVFVLAEQPDSTGIDRVVQQTTADPAQGTFSLCPLPSGNYDIVAAGIDQAGVTYNATVTFAVPAGAAMGDIPLTPEAGVSTAPGEIEGQVTTSTSMATATGADVQVSALQTATPVGGTPVLVTVPLFGSSTPLVTTDAGASCPMGTECASYELFVPASNPVVGMFSSGGTTYAPPAAGDVLYSVNALAFVPGTTDPDCSPSSLTTDKQADGTTLLKATAGSPVTAQTLAFTACQAGF
jgi:hypothetical protein